MQPPRFIIGRMPDGAEQWAAIDPNAHHLESRLGDRRFVAYLTPFPSEEAAREALTAAGAADIAPEAPKRGRRPAA